MGVLLISVYIPSLNWRTLKACLPSWKSPIHTTGCFLLSPLHILTNFQWNKTPHPLQKVEYSISTGLQLTFGWNGSEIKFKLCSGPWILNESLDWCLRFPLFVHRSHATTLSVTIYYSKASLLKKAPTFKYTTVFFSPLWVTIMNEWIIQRTSLRSPRNAHLWYGHPFFPNETDVKRLLKLCRNCSSIIQVAQAQTKQCLFMLCYCASPKGQIQLVHKMMNYDETYPKILVNKLENTFE